MTPPGDQARLSPTVWGAIVLLLLGLALLWLRTTRRQRAEREALSSVLPRFDPRVRAARQAQQLDLLIHGA